MNLAPWEKKFLAICAAVILLGSLVLSHSLPKMADAYTKCREAGGVPDVCVLKARR